MWGLSISPPNPCLGPRRSRERGGDGMGTGVPGQAWGGCGSRPALPRVLGMHEAGRAVTSLPQTLPPRSPQQRTAPLITHAATAN